MKGGGHGAIHRKQGADRLELYLRAQEAIELLMECNGHTDLTKTEFGGALAARYGRKWCKADGAPNRRLVEDVMNLTRDQDLDPTAKELFGGMVVAYAPSSGGMTLIDADGEMALDHMLHMLAGDMQRQQATKTINRRRIAAWKSASTSAMHSGDFDLGGLLAKIENEIDSTGFASDTLEAEFLRLVHVRRSAA